MPVLSGSEASLSGRVQRVAWLARPSSQADSVHFQLRFQRIPKATSPQLAFGQIRRRTWCWLWVELDNLAVVVLQPFKRRRAGCFSLPQPLHFVAAPIVSNTSLDCSAPFSVMLRTCCVAFVLADFGLMFVSIGLFSPEKVFGGDFLGSTAVARSMSAPAVRDGHSK